MANMFALILVIATLVTGILWFIGSKLFFAPKQRERPGSGAGCR